MLPAAYKMEPETPRVSGADELDRCIERVAMCDRDAFAVLYRSTSGAVFAYALSVLKKSAGRRGRPARLLREHIPDRAGLPQRGQAHGVDNDRDAEPLPAQRLREAQPRRAEQPDCDWETLLCVRTAVSATNTCCCARAWSSSAASERKYSSLHAVAGFKPGR